MPTPQNGKHTQTTRPLLADKSFESAWPFCGVGAWRISFYENDVTETSRSNTKNITRGRTWGALYISFWQNYVIQMNRNEAENITQNRHWGTFYISFCQNDVTAVNE